MNEISDLFLLLGLGRIGAVNGDPHDLVPHNLFADVRKRALLASKETIIARDPEIILSFAVSAERMSERPGWASIQAVRKGMIIDDFDQSLLSHGNHRLIEAMEQLQSRFLNALDD